MSLFVLGLISRVHIFEAGIFKTPTHDVEIFECHWEGEWRILNGIECGKKRARASR
jgi:hypothetical protein